MWIIRPEPPSRGLDRGGACYDSRPHESPFARVVKLVDTGDLKSPDHCDRAGSSPAPGTKRLWLITTCNVPVFQDLAEKQILKVW